MSDPRFSEPSQAIQHIQAMINRNDVVEAWLHKQNQQPKHALVESLTHRQHLAELELLINRLHPADIALLLESIPPEQRGIVWHLIGDEHAGATLLELSDSVRHEVVSASETEDLTAAAQHLESDEIVDLVQELPQDVIPDLLSSLSEEERQQVRSAMGFPEDSVGAWMEFDLPVVRDDISLDVVLRFFRRQGELPQNAGKIMVVDDNGLLKGTLALEDLLTKSGDIPISEVIDTNPLSFHTRDSAEEAASSFERYELIVAPVINAHGKLVGVLRVSALLDLIDEIAQRKVLLQAGLNREENLFDPISKSAKNRWPWIALNLLIVFIASRIIDQFDAIISQVVTLAALLPITANIGGNAGNQVVALVIRGLATKQLDRSNRLQLVKKEFSVALVNGALWGTVTGIITLLLYQDLSLAFVMLLAMFCTMLFAAIIGVGIPIALKSLGQDPALGSSVIITGATDTLGFLIFLSLAVAIL
ncbi:magnesium transporter [Neptuniibacter caesariensis]|uniref:Magnesium transporter MgtE n=1 Tax=Neptuniibacter caesariensis TaxID=207954 RepID=A0A7U8GSZ0_NEPCE|nr:magnesium transporter [Neptuniibacter caesariensis]EAR61585.1 magnesium transporter [Oceanospirillum sp. MED92] [Neptuniibacter caesariensis]